MSSDPDPASAEFVLYGVGEHRGGVVRFAQFTVIVRAAPVV
jgi:hypothetical protein